MTTNQDSKPSTATSAIRQMQRDIYRATSTLEFLQTYSTQINRIGKAPYLCGDFMDFDGLTRPQVLEVIRAFPGKYDKTPGYDGGLVYTSRETVLDGKFQVRIYNGEPPASCKIEETIEYVDVPARTERRVTRTVVCPEPKS
jgi:hypothetical protein